MFTSNWQRFKKTETILLSILLYGIVLIYIYNYLQIANKYHAWTTDEFFYYTEAKAVSAHNIYHTPASLDGNTSYIGNFGFHGGSYAMLDGWLSKLFFHAQDPPLIWINFLTSMSALLLILLFKPFTLNIRIKIALVVATHYMFYAFTYSYMQEVLHFLFAVIALRFLYLLYQQKNNTTNQYLLFYLIIVMLATTFRYGWFMWGAGLLPLATDLKSFAKWALVGIGLLAFGIFISRYIAAPYPYDNMVADNLIRTEKFSLMNSLSILWQQFDKNVHLFFTPAERFATTCMRYLLFILLLINTGYAIVKRNKFTIACTLIAWIYFMACLAFYFVFWEYDERALAVLNPILAFSLIGNCNSLIFYPIIALQLCLFPNVIEIKKASIENAIAVNTPTPDRISREMSYSKIKDLITDDQNVVISFPIDFILHGSPSYFCNFPLATSKGYAIHYSMYRTGNDLRKVHTPRYLFTTQPINSGNNKLIYSDKWMCLYQLN